MVEKKPPRKKTLPDVETAVLAKSARRCALCFHLQRDLSEKIGQIAHLDEDRSNGKEDNLAWMCLDHHSLYDSRTKQHKNYTLPEVKHSRARLYDLVAAGKHLLAITTRPELEEQAAWQQKRDLFDQRYAIFLGVRDFIGYVLREDGNIQLTGPGKYWEFWLLREKAQMLFGADVNSYLADVDQTSRAFYVSAKGLERAIATGNMDAINNNAELLNRLSITLLEQRTEIFRPYLAL